MFFYYAAMQYLAFTVLLLSLGFGIAQAFFMGLTNDTGLFMQQALVMWQHPDWMYTRIIQVNAPFHIMLYAPLAAFAAHMHFAPARVLHGFAFLVCIMNLFSLNHALKHHAVAKEDRRVWCSTAAFLLFVIPPPLEVFADREHLLIAFALPWIVQMLLRLRPLPYTAALAAIGFCMRPQDVLIFMTLSFIGGPKEWTLRQRLFSPSSIIIATILGAYAVAIAVLFPAWVTQMIPFASLTYSTVQIPLFSKLGMGFPLFFIMLAEMAGFIRLERMAWYGFSMAMTYLFLMSSGWDYSFYLLMIPLTLIHAAPWCSPFMERIRQKFAARLISACMLAMLFSVCGLYLKEQVISTRETGTSLRHHHLFPALATDLRSAAGKQFILLSTTLWNTDIEPFNGEPRSAFAFDVLWPFHWLVSHPYDSRFSEALYFITTPLLLAMQENPQAPVIIDASPVLSYAGNGSILEILEQDTRVKTAFSSYALQSTIDYCSDKNKYSCRFEVWRSAHK